MEGKCCRLIMLLFAKVNGMHPIALCLQPHSSPSASPSQLSVGPGLPLGLPQPKDACALSA